MKENNIILILHRSKIKHVLSLQPDFWHIIICNPHAQKYHSVPRKSHIDERLRQKQVPRNLKPKKANMYVSNQEQRKQKQNVHISGHDAALWLEDITGTEGVFAGKLLSACLSEERLGLGSVVGVSSSSDITIVESEQHTCWRACFEVH